MNSKLSQSLSMHNLAASFHSDSSGSTPRGSPSSSPSSSHLALDLGALSASTSSLAEPPAPPALARLNSNP